MMIWAIGAYSWSRLISATTMILRALADDLSLMGKVYLCLEGAIANVGVSFKWIVDIGCQIHYSKCVPGPSTQDARD